jgi:flagellar hook-length control protein FliK
MGSSETEIIVELRSVSGGESSAQAETSWETRSSQAFEDILARELHQNLNGDIVRQASVVLKDGGEGTIKLSLRPESLGNVKIHLEMADNKITGHIIVESEEALRAFEKEAASLEQAFRDSGFDGANLDMSLAQDGRGAGDQWRGEEASPFLSGWVAASQYDAALEKAEPAFDSSGFNRFERTSVNMLI